MSVYPLYLLCISKYKHMDVGYIFKKNMFVYILNIYIYKYINVYACKYFLNIYCMCVYLEIHNK